MKRFDVAAGDSLSKIKLMARLVVANTDIDTKLIANIKFYANGDALSPVPIVTEIIPETVLLYELFDDQVYRNCAIEHDKQ